MWDFNNLFSSLNKYFLLFSYVTSYFCLLSAGPGPLDPPNILGLQSRSILAFWISPKQPNGHITNYTLYLFPGSVTSDYKPNSFSNATKSLHTNLSPLINSNSSFHTLSDFTTPSGSDFISVSPFNTVSNIVSSFGEGPAHAFPHHFSTMNPRNVENSDIQSTHFNSSTSSFFSSPSRLTPLSATVPGNTTSYAFVDLLPYQTYILQVHYLKPKTT